MLDLAISEKLSDGRLRFLLLNAEACNALAHWLLVELLLDRSQELAVLLIESIVRVYLDTVHLLGQILHVFCLDNNFLELFDAVRHERAAPAVFIVFHYLLDAFLKFARSYIWLDVADRFEARLHDVNFVDEQLPFLHAVANERLEVVHLAGILWLLAALTE